MSTHDSFDGSPESSVPIGESNRVQIGESRVQIGESNRVQIGESRVQIGESRVQIGESRIQTGESCINLTIVSPADSPTKSLTVDVVHTLSSSGSTSSRAPVHSIKSSNFSISSLLQKSPVTGDSKATPIRFSSGSSGVASWTRVEPSGSSRLTSNEHESLREHSNRFRPDYNMQTWIRLNALSNSNSKCDTNERKYNSLHLLYTLYISH